MNNKLEHAIIWIGLIVFLYWIYTVDSQRNNYILRGQVKEFHGIAQHT